MQFLIHGADQKTGREMTIMVDARDQTEAEQKVLYNDILIASLARFAEPVMEEPPRELAKPEYLRPEPSPQEREKKTRTPIYREILRGAKWLGGLAIFVKMAGVFLLLVAMCLVAVPLVPWLKEVLPLAQWPVAWFAASAVLLAIAFGCMLCGATVSMMSGLALAIRDMARNSFAEESDVKSISRVAMRELIDSEVRQLPSA